MITYLYWAAFILAAFGLFYLIGYLLDKWKWAIATVLVVLFVGWAAYFFYFQQLFVKRYGGVMTVTVPDGQMHIATTWKDDHLWIENYDPERNVCIFSEYSKGNLLEGRVTIKNCNPLRAMPPTPAGDSAAEMP